MKPLKNTTRGASANAKAQASAEYLSNYAIAAIIIVIVLAAFTYLGWLFPNRPPICIFQNGLECDSHYIKLGSNMVSVKAYNRFPDAIVIMTSAAPRQ